MSQRTCLSIILAAGEGTRMKSALPKVLHPIAGLPLAAHVVHAAKAAGAGDIALVIGHGADKVRQAAEQFAPGTDIYVQEQRLGTAHAVLSARAAIARGYDDVIVIFGDTPLLNPDDLVAARAKLAEGNGVVVMGFRSDDPAGYGRLIEQDGRLIAIREAKDCSADELKITFLNGGLMALDGRKLLGLLDRVDNKNAKGEYYLTDIVELANADGLGVVAIEVGFDSVLGINNRAELSDAERIWQERRRRAVMLSGVTLLAPETVYFSHDTELGQDTVVEQHVVFGPGVKVAGDVTIHAFSHLEGATIAAGASIGPYARLRPGTDLREKTKVGNFVEIKKAVVEKGAKVNHLSYIGDAQIGPGANIGAGTITCNYDGYSKFVTTIGANAFVGSNSSLVAPITIGDGAYVASGSVITQDVESDALAFGRARQTTLPGKGKELRDRRADAVKK